MAEYIAPDGSSVSLRFRVRYEDLPLGSSIALEFRLGSYIPPLGNAIALDFSGLGYTPPAGDLVALDFSAKSEVVGPNQYLFPVAIDDSIVATPSIKLLYRYISPQSIYSSQYGVPALKNNKAFIGVMGWQSSAVGTPPSVVSYFKDVYPPSIDLNLYGRPLVYNLTQYRYLRGFDSSEYGKHYLQGGVKYLIPSGYESLLVGTPELVKYILPIGINSLSVSSPSVSPRILYASGIASPMLGKPDIRDPAIKPLGQEHATYGTPTVWYHTRPLSPKSILSYESGFPRVFDPTQFIQTSSLLTSAIFGDTAIRNLSFSVSASSIDSSSFSDYATLTNSNRYYAPNGIDSLAIGAVSIINETPSIFVDGIANHYVGTPAIGHAIRSVYPTGFDRLLLGKPTVIKAPELLVSGHEDSRFTNPTVWFKNRVVSVSARGIDSHNAGEHVTWFKLRPFKPAGWESSSHSLPQLTHGVRVVEPLGFRRDILGIAWVSQGTRLIGAKGISSPTQSNHMVGGTQTIMPAGYEATLWGTRIIPESQSLAPLGFTGMFGDTSVDLATKYIAPVGYISVGQQPADRWGDIVVYNKLQYIVQEYDINSGLVPPKWEGWTAIENRNRVIGAVGFISQKFGYSQIDNNAVPLLPMGIEPPTIVVGMISHGVRTVSTEAIESPLISSWAVVYNAGRVLAPQGRTHSAYGEHSVINTRRYYRNWGMIDSLEMGQPAIGYAIRTIDIEPRYSIAPPQIELPIIDLYTRYIDLVGYKTTKYGTASLSIHFNIIGPSWRHRDDFGYPALKNATPELLVGAFDSQEFGNAGIRTQWREVKAQGDTATLFGSAHIADTKRKIIIRGWQDGISSQQHIVTKTTTNPYVTQNIYLNNESDPTKDGHGIFDPRQFGKIGINQNVLYPAGMTPTTFGLTFVRSNVLSIEVGIAIENIGAGTLVRNKNQFISFDGVEPIKSKVEFGKPRMSPHTIWATADVTQQAKSNHVSNNYLPVDHYLTTKPNGKFGMAGVQSTLRTLRSIGVPPQPSPSYKGFHTVELKDRVIKPRPIASSFLGIPSIPFTPQKITMTDGIFDTPFGVNDVGYGPYTGPQKIEAAGIAPILLGRADVQLSTRHLISYGHNSLSMGASIGKDSPYMWQGLRVGAFIPMSIGAGDTSLFGETFIGLRVRNIELEGFVAFRSEYEPSRFKDRMKVIRSGGEEYNDTQDISLTGWRSEVMGAVEIKLGQHFIRPDGNSDQFRKGAF